MQDPWVMPLEEGVETHSSFPAWRISWTEEPWWATVHLAKSQSQLSKWLTLSLHEFKHILYILCLVAQLCLTLGHPMDCSPPGASVHGDSPGKNTGVGCRALLRGIFPTEGLNPGLPHHRQFLYYLSHQGSP